MKKLLLILFFMVFSADAAMRSNSEWLAPDGGLVVGGTNWESKHINITRGHRYAFHITGGIVGTPTALLQVLVSGNCSDFQVLSDVDTSVLAGIALDDIIQVSNANYNCVKFRITNTAGAGNNYTDVKVLATVKEE